MQTKKRKSEQEPMEVEESASENGGPQISDQDCIMNGELDQSDDEGAVRVGDIYIPPAPKPALTFDATGPRMIITHIVNENFKSYAGVQTLGPFHKVISYFRIGVICTVSPCHLRYADWDFVLIP